jgi:protein phosphatase PTC7
MLIESVRQTKAVGTCTYVMAWMDPKENMIEALNLGDSGYMIVRPPKDDNKSFDLLFRSKEQQYRFNHPYQCGTNYKPPTNADVHAHIVENNDIVILATDGVLDNLFN